ncbi:hypothetical protein [Rhizobium sp. RAF56]|jgi:NAD(P)-dependent dehydrogenase (short-subunit alcohol dehydrogenase family)|uniref:hypothetical protein n=1 Tax=Rhizobium sp. RAF56 TaxID=3233062 RepID=UPI003F96ED58
MSGCLAEKTALVTRRASGIGLAIAEGFPREGQKTAVVNRGAKALEATGTPFLIDGGATAI